MGPAGWLDADIVDGAFASDAIAGHIEIAVNRLASGNPLVDRETRRRIDAKRFPLITGDITSVETVAAGTATVRGIIGFRGEEVEVQGDLVIADLGATLHLTGAAVLDVRWWGLRPPKLLALKVHPEIRVEIAIELSAI